MELGLEATPELYVARMVAIFAEVRRVLKPEGCCFLNLGDSYAGGATRTTGRNESEADFERWREQTGGRGGSRGWLELREEEHRTAFRVDTGLKPKDLCGVPWRVAFALQAGGWWLRNDICWCLSGGTHIYARTQKGEHVCMVRDLARLDPATVQLWNGEKWTQLLGMNKSKRTGKELEIRLMSGERIACTPNHKWPTKRGLVEAADLQVGDVIERTTLPEPAEPRDCALDEDAAWLAGLYIAEGSRSGQTIQLAGHAREEARWERIQIIAAKYGGYATRTVAGNNMSIRLYGKVLVAILDELVSGRVAKDKCFAPVVWRYSNKFLAAMVDGYLHGDGHWDEGNRRWRLGFTRNYNLERDLRTACARLGYKLSLKLSEVPYDGRMMKAFRGEIRTETSGHHSEHDTGEVVSITRAKCRVVYDLGVEDEPHLFALASGVLTHNSKPNAMPESCRDRFSSKHEHVFLLTKAPRYWFDLDAVRVPSDTAGDKSAHAFGPKSQNNGRGGLATQGKASSFHPLGKNPGDVWRIATRPFSGAHFATMPPALVERCLLAGCPPKTCSACGKAWEHRVEKTDEPDLSAKGSRFDQGKTGARDGGDRTQEGGRTTTRDLGYHPACDCGAETTPGLVLDPFAGSGTTAAVSRQHGRRSLGIELNPEYEAVMRERLGVPEGALIADVDFEPSARGDQGA